MLNRTWSPLTVYYSNPTSDFGKNSVGIKRSLYFHVLLALANLLPATRL